MFGKRILIVAITLLGFLYVSSSVVLLAFGLPTGLFNALAKGAIAAMFAVTIFMSSREDIKHSSIGWAMIAFMAAYSIRLLYDVFALDLIFVLQSRVYVLGYFFGLTVIPVIAVFLHMRRSMVADLHNWVLIAVIIANVLLSIYFVVGGVVEDEAQFRGRAQVSGEIEATAVINPITVSLTGVFLFVMTVGRLLAVRTDSFWRQAAFGSLAIYSITNIIIGGSRGPLVALGISLLVIGFLSLRGALGNLAHIRRGMFVFVLGGIGVLIGYISTSGSSLYIVQRFAEMFEARAQGQLEERDFLLADALNDFANSPLIGESYVSRGGGHPHNFIAEALMATGLAGSTFLFIALLFVIVGIWRVLHGRAGPYGVSLALLTICYIVAGLVSGAIGQYPELWVFMAIMMVLGMERAPRDRATIAAQRTQGLAVT